VALILPGYVHFLRLRRCAEWHDIGCDVTHTAALLLVGVGNFWILADASGSGRSPVTPCLLMLSDKLF